MKTLTLIILLFSINIINGQDVICLPKDDLQSVKNKMELQNAQKLIVIQEVILKDSVIAEQKETINILIQKEEYYKQELELAEEINHSLSLNAVKLTENNSLNRMIIEDKNIQLKVKDKEIAKQTLWKNIYKFGIPAVVLGTLIFLN